MIRPRVGLLAVAFASACGPAEPTTPPCDTAVVGLVDHEAWVAFEESGPFASHRPSAPSCPASSFGLEGLVFEVDTGVCDYLSIQQPLLAELDECHVFNAVLSHSRLIAVGAAEAHVALSLADEIVWEKTIPIPSESEIEQIAWRPSKSIPAGAPVRLHLHNHGDNAWYLSNVERNAAEVAQ